jgi:hypothetical protein
MAEYPEIDKLKSLQQRHHFKVRLVSADGSLLLVTLATGGYTWSLFVDDEYGDFNERQPLLCLYLVLRALEDYKDEHDFLKWCNLYGLSPDDVTWLTYYRGLAKSYREIVTVLGEPDSCINSLDYQLRSGAFSALLRLEQ